MSLVKFLYAQSKQQLYQMFNPKGSMCLFMLLFWKTFNGTPVWLYCKFTNKDANLKEKENLALHHKDFSTGISSCIKGLCICDA